MSLAPYAQTKLCMAVAAALLPFLTACAGAAVANVGRLQHAPGTAQHLRRDTPQVSPELDPISHKQFFTKDYPEDAAPTTDKSYKLDYPYPQLQNSSVFDSDYVQDENQDSGEWKAQVHYDELRGKILATRKAIAEIMEDELKNRNVVDASTTEEIDAEEERKQAADKADAAQKKLKAANDKVNKLETAVTAAEERVKRESNELEECEAELEGARAELEKLTQKNVRGEGSLSAKDGSTESDKAFLLKDYEQQVAEMEETQRELDEAEAKLRRNDHKMAFHSASPRTHLALTFIPSLIASMAASAFGFAI